MEATIINSFQSHPSSVQKLLWLPHSHQIKVGRHTLLAMVHPSFPAAIPFSVYCTLSKLQAQTKTCHSSTHLISVTFQSRSGYDSHSSDETGKGRRQNNVFLSTVASPPQPMLSPGFRDRRSFLALLYQPLGQYSLLNPTHSSPITSCKNSPNYHSFCSVYLSFQILNLFHRFSI